MNRQTKSNAQRFFFMTKIKYKKKKKRRRRRKKKRKKKKKKMMMMILHGQQGLLRWNLSSFGAFSRRGLNLIKLVYDRTLAA